MWLERFRCSPKEKIRDELVLSEGKHANPWPLLIITDAVVADLDAEAGEGAVGVVEEGDALVDR